MTAQHPSRDEVPEEDLLEQQAPVDPPPSDQEAMPDLADTAPGVLADDAVEADEADRLEQREVVTGADEEDYPHEA